MVKALMSVRDMMRIEIGEEDSCTGGNDDVKVSLVRNERRSMCLILKLNELDPAFEAHTLAWPPKKVKIVNPRIEYDTYPNQEVMNP